MSFKGKVEVYGANLGVGYVARKYFDSNLGNPIGAAVFGLMDIAGAFSDKIKYGLFTRIAKGLGGAYYGLAFTLPDAIEVFNGELTKIPALILDGSMTFVTARDAIKSYSKSGARVRDDLTSMVQGARNGKDRIKNIL